MDLSKTIKINDKYEISYGIILLTFLVTFFECLGIIAMNGWVFHPSVFFLISNTILLLRKRGEDMKYEEIDERLKELEEKLKERDKDE